MLDIRSAVHALLAASCLLVSMPGGAVAQAPRFVASETAMPMNAANLNNAEAAFVAAHPVIRVAVQGDQTDPILRVAPDGVISGYSIDVLQALAGAIGLRIEPVLFDTWPEVLDALRSRRVDLSPNIGYTAERGRYLDFTPGIVPTPGALIGRVGDDRFERSRELAGFRVAVGEGFAAEKHLRASYPLATVVPEAGYAGAIEAVSAGRADLYFGEMVPAMIAANSIDGPLLEIKRPVFYASGWTHIGVRSDWPLLTGLLSHLISGRRDAIYDGFARTWRGDAQWLEAPLPLDGDESQLVGSFSVLKVGAVRGLALLNDVSPSGEHTGVASEFASYLSHRLGVALDVVPFDSTLEMIEALQAQRIDLIPFIERAPQIWPRLVFSDPYLRMPYLLLGRVDDTAWWDLDSLVGRTLALSRGHPLLPLLRRDHEGIRVLEFEDDASAMQAVASRLADATVQIKLFANLQLNGPFEGRLRMLATVDDAPGAFAFAASGRAARLIPIVDRALAQMSPALRERSIRRWVAVDLEPIRQLRQTLRVAIPSIIVLGLVAAMALYWSRRLGHENRRRRIAERRLVEMTDRLRTGVFQFLRGQDGKLTREFVNAGARAMARIGDSDPLHAHLRFFDHVDAAQRPAVLASLLRSFETREPFRESFRFEFPDGTKGWILAEAVAHPGDDGSQRWSGYLFDLTSERSLNESLNAMIREKDRFIAIAGHELRTPVHNILLGIGALDATGMSTRQIAAIDSIRAQALDLALLIGDLLDLSRLESRGLALADDRVDLRAVLRAASQGFEPAFDLRGLSLETVVSPGVPRLVRGDAIRLRQVIDNLVGNALKFTENGSVRVTIEIENEPTAPVTGSSGPNSSGPNSSGSDATAELRIVVEDTGIGIAGHDIGRLFEPFTTLGPLSRDNTGLGLAITQRLVNRMSGQIEVRSTPGKGSVFAAHLSLRVVSDVDSSAAIASAPVAPTASVIGERFDADTKAAPSLGDRRLLLVDDDRFGRTILASLLEQTGFLIEQAEGGDEALEMLNGSRYSVVITDNWMPGMTGIELARRIREVHSRADSPERPRLIAMTAGLTEEESRDAQGVFDAILIKPVSSAEIEKTIGSCMAASV